LNDSACNYSIESSILQGFITSALATLSGVVTYPEQPAITYPDLKAVYIAKQGETISDIVLNSTGSILNWETLLNLNDLDDWTPTITPGQSYIIEAIEPQQNVLNALIVYPACNYPGFGTLLTLISDAIATLDSQFNKEFEDVQLFDYEDSQQYLYEN
jgi:hypothetical protein